MSQQPEMPKSGNTVTGVRPGLRKECAGDSHIWDQKSDRCIILADSWPVDDEASPRP